MELSDVPSPNPERKRGKEKKKIKSYLGKKHFEEHTRNYKTQSL